MKFVLGLSTPRMRTKSRINRIGDHRWKIGYIFLFPCEVSCCSISVSLILYAGFAFGGFF